MKNKGLGQILKVVGLVFHEGKNYNEAVKIVAEVKKVTEATVSAACTGGIGLKTARFKELLRDRDPLYRFLREKFPEEQETIRIVIYYSSEMIRVYDSIREWKKVVYDNTDKLAKELEVIFEEMSIKVEEKR